MRVEQKGPPQVGANLNSELLAEARQHLGRAQEAASQAGESAALADRIQATEADLRIAEAWAGRCEECAVALRRGKEALAAGSRDEAAGHCRAARGLVDGGLRGEALRAAVQELEQELSAGQQKHLYT